VRAIQEDSRAGVPPPHYHYPYRSPYRSLTAPPPGRFLASFDVWTFDQVKSGPLWVIFAATFLHTLSHIVPYDANLMEAADAVRKLVKSPVVRSALPPRREIRRRCRGSSFSRYTVGTRVGATVGVPREDEASASTSDVHTIVRCCLRQRATAVTGTNHHHHPAPPPVT
jgi:hypothetical protein